MKILVFADSHGDAEFMAKIIGDEGPEAIIHLGDNYSDANSTKRLFPKLESYTVAGNCDFGADYPLEQFVNIAGKRVLITHGHRYQVKTSLSLIKDRGLMLGADITLFGHTHKSYLDCVNGMHIMNPGHIGRFTHNSNRPSYGRIQIENSDIRCDIRQV